MTNDAWLDYGAFLPTHGCECGGSHALRSYPVDGSEYESDENGLRTLDEPQAEAVLHEIKDNSTSIGDPHFRHWAAATVASYFSAKVAA